MAHLVKFTSTLVFLQCICSPGWMGEFCQYVSDACLIKPNRCLNGATCITTSQMSSPPEYVCKCTNGFTGERDLSYLSSLEHVIDWRKSGRCLEKDAIQKTLYVIEYFQAIKTELNCTCKKSSPDIFFFNMPFGLWHERCKCVHAMRVSKCFDFHFLIVGLHFGIQNQSHTTLRSSYCTCVLEVLQMSGHQ